MKCMKKRLLSLLLCTVMVFGLVPDVSVYAAEEKEEERVTAEAVVTEPVSTLALRQEDSYYYFSTFEDFKDLVSESLDGWTYAYYEGTEPFVFSENVEIPEYLDINFQGQDIRIAKNVTVKNANAVRAGSITVDGSLYAEEVFFDGTMTVNGSLKADTAWGGDDLIVHGVMNAERVEVAKTVNVQGAMSAGSVKAVEALKVSGSLYVANGFKLYDDTVVTGRENIVCDNGVELTYYVDDFAGLKKAVAAAGSEEVGFCSIRVTNTENIVISESLTVPMGTDLILKGEGGITIQEGCTLKIVQSDCNIYAPIQVNGTLINDGGWMFVYYNDGAVLSFGSNASYSGHGSLNIFQSNLTDPQPAVPGLDLTDLEITGEYRLRDVTGLTKLGTPTGLSWGEKGAVKLSLTAPYQGTLNISIYRVDEDGNAEWCTGRSYEIDADMEAGTELSLDAFAISVPQSGTYYFEAGLNGDYETYCDSDTATSGTYNYTKPEAQLSACTNLSWDGLKASYTAPVEQAYVGGYEIDWHYSETGNVEEDEFIVGSARIYNGKSDVYKAELSQEIIQEYGAGYYYFDVCPLSNNIEVYSEGVWSGLSPAYHVTEVSKDVADTLNSILGLSVDAEEIKTEVQSMDTDALKEMMMEDSAAVDKLAHLEKMAGGAATVTVTKDASAFDQSKVSVVGANLNSTAAAGEITLIIDKPEKEDVIPALYDSSAAVRFSMTLENVKDPKNLAVPVKITLPVPAAINPDNLVILHYHEDGTVETLEPSVYQEDEQWYASIVLTSFSDFVMTQKSAERTGVERIYGDTRYETSFGLADALKKEFGVQKFQNVIIACGNNFADALSGSYLAAVKNAPILLVNGKQQKTMDAVKDYIAKNVVKNGNVYILGGPLVVPETMKNGLEDYHVKRLAGDDRYETNLEILKEAGVEGKDILVATGRGFADSLSASASGLPILLVGKNVTEKQQEFLKGTTGKKIVLGGINAVSDKVMNAVGATERLGGENRYETSVMVAEAFIKNPDAAVLAYASNFPDGLCGGPLAYAMNAPLVLTKTGTTEKAAAYAAKAGLKAGVVIGGPKLISDAAADEIF